jgi:hypothetical protein
VGLFQRWCQIVFYLATALTGPARLRIPVNKQSTFLESNWEGRWRFGEDRRVCESAVGSVKAEALYPSLADSENTVHFAYRARSVATIRGKRFFHHPPAEARCEGKADNTHLTSVNSDESGPFDCAQGMLSRLGDGKKIKKSCESGSMA